MGGFGQSGKSGLTEGQQETQQEITDEVQLLNKLVKLQEKILKELQKINS